MALSIDKALDPNFASRSWGKYRAADLLARAEQGLFDVSVQLQGYRPNSSGTRTKGKGDRPGKLEESEISYYYRSLWQTAKHAKVDWVGELPLPEPVPLTAEQVIRGLFPENGYIWLGEKVNRGEVKRIATANRFRSSMVSVLIGMGAARQ